MQLSQPILLRLSLDTQDLPCSSCQEKIRCMRTSKLSPQLIRTDGTLTMLCMPPVGFHLFWWDIICFVGRHLCFVGCPPVFGGGGEGGHLFLVVGHPCSVGGSTRVLRKVHLSFVGAEVRPQRSAAEVRRELEAREEARNHVKLIWRALAAMASGELASASLHKTIIIIIIIYLLVCTALYCAHHTDYIVHTMLQILNSLLTFKLVQFLYIYIYMRSHPRMLKHTVLNNNSSENDFLRCFLKTGTPRNK